MVYPKNKKKRNQLFYQKKKKKSSWSFDIPLFLHNICFQFFFSWNFYLL